MLEKLMLVPEDIPKVAVPVGTAVFGFQFALLSKSKLPVTGPAMVGVVSQVASCATPGDAPAKAPITQATIAAADTRALRMTFPTQRPAVPTEIATAPSTCLFICPTPAPCMPILGWLRFFRPDDFSNRK